MSEELKPCPHCAGEANFGVVEQGGDANPDFGGHFIQCANPDCYACMGLRFACGDDPRMALAEAWNTRAALATPQPAEAQEIVEAGGLDWLIVCREYEKSALSGEWPGIRTPHYALSGAFKAIGDEIQRLTALSATLSPQAGGRNSTPAEQAKAIAIGHALDKEDGGFPPADNAELVEELEELLAEIGTLPLSEWWMYFAIRHCQRNMDIDYEDEGCPPDRQSGTALAKLVNRLPRILSALRANGGA